jgi:dUTP pyrophosphatase
MLLFDILNYLCTGIVAYFTYDLIYNPKNSDSFKLVKRDEACITIQHPKKGSLNSAGWDIYSNQTLKIPPGQRQLVSSGWRLQYLSNGYYLRIAPRSGLACKGIDIGAGVVDADYRGEIKVLVINNSKVDFMIDTTIRIAQIIPEKCGNLNLLVDDDTTPTVLRETRGDGGFGSTG